MYYQFEESTEPKAPFSEQNAISDSILRKLTDSIYWVAMVQTKGNKASAEALINDLANKAPSVPSETLSVMGAYLTYLSTQKCLISDLNALYERSASEDTRELAETAIYTLNRCEEMFEKAINYKNAI